METDGRMAFQCIDDLESGWVLYLDIDSPQTPAPLLTSSLDNLKSSPISWSTKSVMWKKFFSAPRQLISRGCRRSWLRSLCDQLKQIRSVISVLSVNFLLNWASRYHDSAWPRDPLLSEVWVKRDPNQVSRGSFCTVVQAHSETNTSPNVCCNEELVDRFVHWDISHWDWETNQQLFCDF